MHGEDSELHSGHKKPYFLLQVMRESICLHLVKATTKKVQIYHTFIKQVSLCWEINHAAHCVQRASGDTELVC